MKNSITDVPGIRVGHIENLEGATGCTVILCEDGAIAGVDVRGGAPGVREIATLDPVNFVDTVHAIYLGGGSAYGLDGASGVMQYLEEQGKGLDVGVGIVPIVPGAVLFDLPVKRHDIRPDKAMGYAACLDAAGTDYESEIRMGNVGAGTGATIGKPAGPAYIMKGGLGTASRKLGDLIIGAIVAVNCFGDIIDPSTGKIIAGALNESKDGFPGSLNVISKTPAEEPSVLKSNTTIGAIATNGKFTKPQMTKIAQMAHDGFARTINPIHTMYDGDTIFALSTGEVTADVTTLGAVAAEVMAEAVLNGIKAAESAFGIPGYKEIKEKIKEKK
ncbi:MAG: P1 family peptidase [Spirochaetales bacterium]|nr:P1 family peptidase [Spirochaetales bacterium]